jgi:hypothetical protein
MTWLKLSVISTTYCRQSPCLLAVTFLTNIVSKQVVWLAENRSRGPFGRAESVDSEGMSTVVLYVSGEPSLYFIHNRGLKGHVTRLVYQLPLSDLERNVQPYLTQLAAL